MVFRGREGTFCSGFDLDELQSDFVGNTYALEIAQRSARILDGIFNSRKPSVCVLEGHTTAGGFEIMDKGMRREIFLDGPQAEHFKRDVDELMSTEPTFDEFDAFLAGYAGLMTQPLAMH